jgi:predicted dehydrogenase
MINVGLIGTGYIGPVHLEALSRIGGIRVKAVCDINRTLAEDMAKRYRVEYTFDDYEKIVNDDEIDVIHNCTPNRHHYEITKRALQCGKHVLSEKPLAMKTDEAWELVELGEQKGVVTGVDFCYRYYPVVQEMALRIKRGDLGEVRMVTGSYLQGLAVTSHRLYMAS